jgi:hypothetical protein
MSIYVLTDRLPKSPGPALTPPHLVDGLCQPGYILRATDMLSKTILFIWNFDFVENLFGIKIDGFFVN